VVIKTSNAGQCNICSLSEDAVLRGVGDLNTNRQVDILLVFSYIPYGLEKKDLHNIHGDSNVNQLIKAVRAAHPDKSVGATSVIKCLNYTKKPKTDNYRACADNHLYNLYRRMRPKITIAVGAKAASMFTNEKNLDNGEIVGTKYGRMMFITDLSEMAKDYNYEDKFVDAIQWLFKTKESFRMTNFDIDIPSTTHELDLIEADILKHDKVFLDIEGSTLPFRNVNCGNKVMCASFTVKESHAFVIPMDSAVSHYNNSSIIHQRAIELVRKVCGSPIIKIGHNLKYDSLFLAICNNVMMKNFKADTMLMHYLFDERPPHGLKPLCNLYVYKLANYDKELEEYIIKHAECDPKKDGSYFYIPNHILFPYNGLDTIACMELYKYFKDKVYGNKQWAWLMENVMIPATKVYMRMEYNGFQTDNKALMKFGGELNNTIIKYRQELATYLVANGLPANLNMNAPEQIAQAFINLGEVAPEELKKNAGGKYTCDDKVVTTLLNKGSNLAYLVNGLKKTIKKKNTYVDNYLLKCDILHRLHASYAMHFTDTGRSSCSDPNLQNVPSSLRKYLIPSPGHIIIERDFSQLELRLMACRTADPVMLEIYKRNEDIHKMTAASSELIVNNPDTLTSIIDSGDIGATIKFIMDYYNSLDKSYAKKLRQKAKAPNFHFIYGGYFKTLAVRINTDIEKMMKEMKLAARDTSSDNKKLIEEQLHHLKESKISEDEAQNFEEAFFTLYKEIKTYHSEVDDFVKNYGYVESPFGRIKHLPDGMLPDIPKNRKRISSACNAAKNFWIQSSGADLKFLSLIKLQKELDHRNMDTLIINEVHDSIIMDVPISEVFDVFKLSAECMDHWDEQFPEFVICKIPTDAKICIKSWGQGVEVANEEELEKLLKTEKLI
jgi:DNA polymerase I-like protein with 3'-5' exonuclease and polymerase domains/uracil-DNA glycosylase